MGDTSLAGPTRKLRLLGDGIHGETRVAGNLESHEVEQSPYDSSDGYRNTYVIGVYSDPDAARVADSTSLDAPGCPCNSTF